ncbi:hypothetical protein PHMEG_00026807 [Phytophthora megakarya]|uniref:Aspartic protease n=1 Tax=Phytophthora megakarya TaxID=4795 RepID=A0A225V9I4_9STRA|nr:hypothetical protein PHMEG_00026807 [Phytophthora megakarya]
MDFIVPAGIRLDMADGSLCLPDEVRIQLSGRHQLFSGNSRLITFDQHHRIPVAGSVEIAIRKTASDRQKLWVTRGEQWAPTAVKGLGNTQYLRITNVSERPVTLQRDTRVGIWLAGDHVPRMSGFVSIGSRRYAEWLNLALQATTEQQAVDEVIGTATKPMVDRPQYEPPTKILAGRRERPKAMIVMSASARESITAPGIVDEVRQGFNRRKKAIRRSRRERSRVIENSLDQRNWEGLKLNRRRKPTRTWTMLSATMKTETSSLKTSRTTWLSCWKWRLPRRKSPSTTYKWTIRTRYRKNASDCVASS